MILTLAHKGIAQVEWKDRYVTLKPGDQRNPSVASPYQAGATIVVWEDQSNPDDVNIYAQKIDNTTGVTLWQPPDGVPVCAAMNHQRNPRAAYDSLGGVYITWEDYRDDPNNQQAAIYIQRLDISDGSVSTNWPTDGILLSDVDYHAERPRIVSAIDGAYVVWVDWRNYSTNSRDIYASHILFDAQIAGGNWPSSGINVSSSPSADQTNAEIAVDWIWRPNPIGDSRTGVVIVYQDKRNTYWNIVADNLDVTGARQYGDVEVAKYDTDQENPQLVVTGELPTKQFSDAIIVWEDLRNGNRDLYRQRLDESGSIVWTHTGDPLCDASGSQANHVLTLWETQDPQTAVYKPYVTAAWEDSRNADDIFAALLDVEQGSIATPNGTLGEPICATGNEALPSIDNIPYPIRHQSTMSTVYIAWQHAGARGSDIHFQAVEIPNWTLVKPANGWPVTEAKGDQNIPQVSGNVFVYEDGRRDPIGQPSDPFYDPLDDYNIYAQTPGECVGPKEMNWRDMFVQWGHNAQNMKFVVDPLDKSIFVAWDQAQGDENVVYIQKFDKDGVPRWQNNGIRLSDAGWLAQYPDVVTDRAGGAQVVWKQESGGTAQIWYAHIDVAGTVSSRNVDYRDQRFWPTTRTPGVPQRPYCVENFYWGSSGNAADGVLIAFLDDNGTDIVPYQGWVDFAGNNGGGAILNLSVAKCEDLMMTTDNTGGCYLLVHGATATGYDIIAIWQDGIINGQGSFTSNTQNFSYDSFGGYDITTDVFAPASGPYHAGVAVAIDWTNPPYRYVFHIRLMGSTSIVSPLWTLIIGWDCTMPSISSNLYYDPTNGFGGFLISWDVKYRNLAGQDRHMVQTTDAVLWVMTTPPSLFTSFIYTLDSELLDYTHPVVSPSAIVGPYQASTGYVAWEGFSEACSPSPSVEIKGQYVIYETVPGYSYGGQWIAQQPNYMRVGPSVGYHSQKEPMIRQSDKDANVFWYDTRTGSSNLVGTTMYDGSGDIMWRKTPVVQQQIPARNIYLHDSYPNPVSVSTHTKAIILYEVPEAAHASIRVFDILGKEVMTLKNEAVQAGKHMVPFSPSAGGLKPGVYMYTLTLGQKTESRPLVLIP